MFSYALRQIQPRSVSPSRARLPVQQRSSLILRFCSRWRDTRLYELYTRIALSSLGARSRPFFTRAENARPSLTGQERSGPAGRSVVTIIIIIFFLLTNCTATSVLFINFYFCCYVCSITAGTCTVYTYACAGV